MLVLSRKKDESITIGKDIRITILSDPGSRVRLGIEAPKQLAILREELGKSHDELSSSQSDFTTR